MARESKKRTTFDFSQFSALPRREGSQVERAELAAHEFGDRMPHLGEHAAHDPVASGVQRELDEARSA
jgi:hypothetical protein